MTQTPYTKPTRYIHCPVCGKGDFAVCHLPVGCRTRWYCDQKDECGAEFDVNVLSLDEIECIPTGGRSIETVVTLRCTKPFTMTVSGLRQEPIDELMDWTDSQRYFYEEHSCPVNSFRSVIEIFDADGKEDPHGILEFVKVEFDKEQ